MLPPPSPSPPPRPPPHHHHHHHSHVIAQTPPPKPNPKLLSLIIKALVMTFITSVFFLFLGFAATVLFPFFAAGALHRRRTQSPHRSSGFSPKHLKTLPQFRFRAARAQPQSQSSSSSPSPQTDCVVCLDSFREGQWCRKLPACDHVFHRRCLDTWLVKVSACPICRTRVRIDYGDTESVVDLDGEEEAKYLWNFNRNNNGLQIKAQISQLMERLAKTVKCLKNSSGRLSIVDEEEEHFTLMCARHYQQRATQGPLLMHLCSIKQTILSDNFRPD